MKIINRTTNLRPFYRSIKLLIRLSFLGFPTALVLADGVWTLDRPEPLEQKYKTECAGF
jgi:hypothetical protein